MPSTYSNNLKIQLMATGENSTTWGNVTNTNLGTAIEEAITGSADVAFSNANVTLTLSDDNTSQAARNIRLNLTGTATSGYNLIVPSVEKIYAVNNGTDGTITVKNSTGTGIAVPAGKTMWVFNDGTNVVDVVTHLSSVTLGSALPVASGGTGSTTASGARTSLGLGSIATQSASSVSITGGSISGASLSSVNLSSSNVTITGGSVTGITDIAVADGGTGASTAANARINLLPSYSGNALKTLRLNSSGTDVEWAAESGTGTVTSVDASGGATGLTFSGGPITTAGTLSLGGTLAIASGGTGSTTASGARSALGLGSIATQNSNSVSITGGSITGITDITVADGGTGASTASQARTNLGVAIGTNVQAYDATLTALAAYNTNGLLTQTATDTFTGRTLTAGSAKISISNGNGVSGNPTIDLGSVASTDLSDSASIVTLTGAQTLSNKTISGSSNTITNVSLTTGITGTLAIANGGTGSTTAAGARSALGLGSLAVQNTINNDDWSGTDLSVANGGTGQSSYTNGQLLIGNTTGNTLTKATLTAGSGISITNGNGSITIASTAGGGGTVTSIDVAGGTTGLTFSGGPITTSGTITMAGTLDLDNGGTGATTASGARTNLGLGSMATQNSGSVSITGGSISGITDLAVADGGTGSSTAAGARTNLGLAIGTNVQAYSPVLADFAGLTQATDTLPYFNSSSTATTTGFTAFGRSLIAAADAAAGRTELGLGTLATASSINNSNWSGTDLAVANGGTGASDAATARANLGAGTVSSVGGTGTVNGISLSGTVTSSGSLTLGGTLSGVSLTTQVTGTLPLANGGTGATTAGGARTNLGLGTIATQSAASVSITGGSITGITDLAIADGGTGASTAADARTNLGLGTLATANTINNSNWSGTDLAVVNGGTGASDAAGARTNLGLGSIATQNSGSVSITGGSVTGITDLAVADGGTGASTASDARTNLGIGSMATRDVTISTSAPTGGSDGDVWFQYTA